MVDHYLSKNTVFGRSNIAFSGQTALFYQQWNILLQWARRTESSNI
jgi:hypothetical protein